MFGASGLTPCLRGADSAFSPGMAWLSEGSGLAVDPLEHQNYEDGVGGFSGGPLRWT